MRRLATWLLWWRRPEVEQDQAERDAKVEAAGQYAELVSRRLEKLADAYREAEQALSRR